MIETAAAPGSPKGHLFTKNTAAEACGVNVSTIKRRMTKGAFPNSYQDSDGIWRIPLGDLIAAGLNPGAPVEPGARPGGEMAMHEGHAPTPFAPSAPAVPLPLEEYRELIEAKTERDQLREMLRRADEVAEDARKNAWQWYQHANELMQRQITSGPVETPAVVDVRTKKTWFGRKNSDVGNS